MRAIAFRSLASRRVGLALVAAAAVLLAPFTAVLTAAPALAYPQKAALLSPINGSVTSDPGDHHTVYSGALYYGLAGDWAVDIGGGGDVYARFATDGTLALEVLSTFDACANSAARGGGRAVAIRVMVDGVEIARIVYAHLANERGPGPLENGGRLGSVYTGPVKDTSCWTGPHVHVEPSNAKKYSCFTAAARQDRAVDATTRIGVVGGEYVGGTRQQCPPGAEATGAPTASPAVAVQPPVGDQNTQFVGTGQAFTPGSVATATVYNPDGSEYAGSYMRTKQVGEDGSFTWRWYWTEGEQFGTYRYFVRDSSGATAETSFAIIQSGSGEPTPTPSPSSSASPDPSPSASASLSPTPPGSVSPSPTTPSSSPPPPAQQSSAIRLAGADRYATAVAVSQSFARPGVANVFIATGSTFPDALAAAPAAAITGSPVLLVDPDFVPQVIFSELDRLRPGHITILGGPAAVGDAVEQMLARYASISRLAGVDRASTSAAISRATFGRDVATAFVATGNSYPDALSGGAAAGNETSPVLLLDRDAIPASVNDELRRLNPQRIVVLGGKSAISDRLLQGLAALARSVERVAGEDRYATAAAVAERFSAPTQAVYLATGLNFADALAASPLAGSTGGPLILVPGDCVTTPALIQLNRLSSARRVIIGGLSVVSEEVAQGRAC